MKSCYCPYFGPNKAYISNCETGRGERKGKERKIREHTKNEHEAKIKCRFLKKSKKTRNSGRRAKHDLKIQKINKNEVVKAAYDLDM